MYGDVAGQMFVVQALTDPAQFQLFQHLASQGETFYFYRIYFLFLLFLFLFPFIFIFIFIFIFAFTFIFIFIYFLSALELYLNY